MAPSTMGAIRAASPLESIPPERKSPSGTSLMRWLRTAPSSRALTSRARGGGARGLAPRPARGGGGPPPPPVPQREGEHPRQALPARVPRLFVEVEDGLGVAPGPVVVPLRLERRAQLGVVVDLAVVGDPDALVLVRHRLMPRRHVHDGQAAVTQAGRSVHPEPLAVRPPMAEDVTHPLEPRLVRGFLGIEPDDA